MYLCTLVLDVVYLFCFVIAYSKCLMYQEMSMSTMCMWLKVKCNLFHSQEFKEMTLSY